MILTDEQDLIVQQVKSVKISPNIWSHAHDMQGKK